MAKREQLELLMNEFDKLFFKKRDATTEEYVDTIISLSEISTKLGIPLEKLFDSVKEKIRDRHWLTRLTN